MTLDESRQGEVCMVVSAQVTHCVSCVCAETDFEQRLPLVASQATFLFSVFFCIFCSKCVF